MKQEMIIRALSFGEHVALKHINVADLDEMLICLMAAIANFDNATEEQMENEEAYQYFCGWCDKYLTQEFCDNALDKITI